MPFEDDVAPVAPRGPLADPVRQQRDIGGMQLAGAAFRQVSPVGSVLNALTTLQGVDSTPDPSLDVWREIADTRYAQYADAFVNVRNRAQLEAVRARIDREDRDNSILADSGAAGVVAGLSMGLVDPTIVLPGGAIYRSVKGGYAVGRTAAAGAAAGAVQGAASEALLQGSQVTRRPEEWLTSVASSAILGGILGGGAAALLSRGERLAIEQGLDEIRGLGGPLASSTAPGGGAATSDLRENVLVRSGMFEKIPTWLRSPTQRVMTSQITETRRIAGDLVELALTTEGNRLGIPNTSSGIPVDSEVRRLKAQMTYRASSEMDRLYREYRFGPEDGSIIERGMNAVQGAIGQDTGFLSKQQFREEIAKAMRRGDVSDNPQVQAAAQMIRKDIVDPMLKRAQDAGLLPEELQVKGAESWFMRIYNRQALEANGPEFIERTTRWLRMEENRKIEIKAQIENLSTQRQQLREQLEAMAAKNTDEAIARQAEIQTRLDELQGRIEERLANWGGNSVAEAKTAIKTRQKAEAARAPAADGSGPKKRLTSADDAVDRAVKRILARAERDDLELKSRAQEIRNRILSTPDGRLPYDIASPRSTGFSSTDPLDRSAPRGSLATRDFAIPDEMIEDFLVNDAEEMVHRFANSFLPDVALKEKFPNSDLKLTQEIKRILDESDALQGKAKSEKERVAIGKQAERDIRDIAAFRDRIRSTYGAEFNQKFPGFARFANVARMFNQMTLLGGAGIASLVDIGGAVYRYGISSVAGKGWAPAMQSMITPEIKGLKGRQKRQLQAMGIGIETFTASQMRAMDSVNEAYRPTSRFERGIDAASQAFFIANLQAPITDMQKHAAGAVVMDELLQMSKRVSDGTASPKDISRLAENFMSPDLAKKVWAEFSKPGAGETIDGITLPNVDRWADAEARRVFEAAVMREVDIAVITPGQEKPLLMSNPIVGLLTQFKSFTAAASERLVLAQLQQADARTLQGLIVSITAGGVAVAAGNIAADRPLPERPQDWIKESMEKSGVLGWLSEANQFTAKATAGTVDIYRIIGADKPLQSRNASATAMSQLLGPTAGKLEGILKATSSGFSEEGWDARATQEARRLLLGQNIFYTRRLFNEAEDSINRAMGIEPLDRDTLGW